MSTPSDAQDLAAHALTFLDGEGQATVERERSLLLRYARQNPTQATELDDTSVHLLALRDGHAGGATTNRTDDESLRTTAKAAMAAAEAAARAAGGSGDHPGLPGPPAGGYPQHDGYDEETAQLDPAPGGAALATAFETAAAHDLEAFGVYTAGAVQTAIATSTGIHAVDRVTDAYMKVMCRSADARTGQASQAAIAAADLDPGAIARAAAAKVVGGEPVRLPPGEYPVVLDAEAVGGLLEMLGALAFNGLAHAEGRGALDGRLGRQVAADIITIADTTNNSRTWPRAFDFEGVPKAPITLIDQGIARHVVHDTRSAAVAGAGARSTGHAIAPGGSASGPYATNLILAPGDAPDVAALAAPIERGLYVTRLWYLNVVHPKQTLLTGTTRDGTFLVEDGKITRPARDVRLTDSVLRILSATEQLTAAPRLTTDAEYYGRRFATGAVCPALRAGGFRVTG